MEYLFIFPILFVTKMGDAVRIADGERGESAVSR